MEIRSMDFGEAREVARLRVRMLEELGELGAEDPQVLVGPVLGSVSYAAVNMMREWLRAAPSGSV